MKQEVATGGGTEPKGLVTMLVISRRKEEEFVICAAEGSITVRICRLGNGKVSLGITAPDSVRVYRREVFERLGDPDRTAA